MAVPIWKDYIVDLGAPAVSGAGVSFHIYCVTTDADLFYGTAYVKPGESTAKVRINDICADYLGHYFLEAEDAEVPARATFRVYAGATQKDEVDFFNDWSYNPLYDPAVDGLNFPVVYAFVPGQYIPVSVWSGSPGTATVHMANGTTYSVTPTKQRGGDFNDDYNDDFLRRMEYFGDSYVIPMADYYGAVSVEYGGKTWVLSNHCPQYVLYYVNEHGGWDALPVEGKTGKSDAVTRHTAGQVYDNGQPSARGLRNFVNELKRNFEFWTGWLTEAQSSLMHNILNSPSVYVHDLATGFVHPLVLTGSTTEYKHGRPGLFAYKIEAQLAQDRMRR